MPARTPFHDLTADPPPGVGPYEITASEPGREFVLERTPNFPDLDIPDIPTGNIDRITTRIVPSVREQAQQVLDGRLDYMQDEPPPAMRARVRAQAQDRFIEHATASTYYFFLNQDLRPFDDPLVREAVNRAIDRRALAYLYGGSVQPGCTLLAPGVPGYDEDLDTKRCPYAAPGQIPDLRRARALIRQAGAEGERVTVWGSRAADSRPATELYARTLTRSASTRGRGWSTPAATTRRSAIAARGRRPGSTPGSRTSPTRSTSSSSWTATRSSRDTTPTRATSTTRSSTARSTACAASTTSARSPPTGGAWTSTWSRRRRATSSSSGTRRLRRSSPSGMDPGSAVFHPLYRNDYSSWRLEQGD